ncbi:hypothetical protein ABJY79_22840 [Vibrio parahaemolyticus]|nr:hypothetical protein [Vibrio parahaemolyticus]
MSNHQIFLNIRVLVLHNAALSGEQRDHPNLNFATFSTKAALN